MKKLLLTLALAVFVFSNYSVNAEAHGHKGHKGYDKIYQELDLSDSQKKQLEEIRLKFKENRKEIYDQMRTAKDKLHDAMKADASKEELRKLHAEVQQIKIEKGNQRFEKVLMIRDILTPEQRVKFHELKEEKKRYHKKGKKHKKD